MPGTERPFMSNGTIMGSFLKHPGEHERTCLLPQPTILRTLMGIIFFDTQELTLVTSAFTGVLGHLDCVGKDYRIPKRFMFSFMAFIACCLTISFNMNISIAIVSMVERTNESAPISQNLTDVSFIQKGETFDWNADVQGLVLGAVYYGQLVSFIPGGRMAELYGGKRMLIICTLLSSLANVLSPILAHWNVYAFVVGRIILGLGTGQVLPIVFYMLSKWIPVTERSFHASFIISGYGIGSFATVIISGALCGSTFLRGWPSVFYTGAFFGILWCIVAFFTMYESPDNHPSISSQEMDLIVGEQMKEDMLAKIDTIPWKDMMLSVPLWALSIGFFGQFWLLGFFSTVHATYMGVVLGLPIVKNGVLSSLPHLLRAFATCLASWPVDIMLKKDMVSVGFVRKGATAFNSVVSCVAFLGITLVGHNAVATTLLFVLGGIFGEFVTFGVCMACVDIAPSLSGTVSGIVNVVGVLPFFIVPALVGEITNYEASIEKWKMVFYVTIIITMATTLIFVVFGDLTPQKWGTAKIQRGTLNKNNSMPPKTIEQDDKDHKSLNSISNYASI